MLVTALGSRCHLEGPVAAAVPTVRSWAAPGPEEGLQPPTEGHTSSLAEEGLAGGAREGPKRSGRPYPSSASFLGIPRGSGWALCFSATRWQQWAGQVPALRGSGRTAQHAVSPAAL